MVKRVGFQEMSANNALVASGIWSTPAAVMVPLLPVWLSGMVSRSLHANDSPRPQLILFFELLNGGFISEPAICSINM